MSLKKLADYGLKFKELKGMCISLNEAKITGVEPIITKVGTKGEVMLSFFLDGIDQVPDDCIKEIPKDVVTYHKAIPQEVYDDDDVGGIQNEDKRVHTTPKTTKKKKEVEVPGEITSECADFKTGWDGTADDCTGCAEDFPEEHAACKTACVPPTVEDTDKAVEESSPKDDEPTDKPKDSVKKDKPAAKSKGKAKKDKGTDKPAAKQKEPKKRSRYGHMATSMAASIDNLVWKGSTMDTIVSTLVKSYDRTEKAAKAKATSHIKHLINTKGIEIKETDGVFKATDEFAKGFDADNTVTTK